MGARSIEQEIIAANADLEERLRHLGVRVTYDDEFDIFLLAIGEPQEAMTEEVEDGHGLQIRVDPETLKIVGFEIMGFRRRYLKAHPEFRPHFLALFDKEPLEERQIPPEEHRKTQEALRSLAPALG